MLLSDGLATERQSMLGSGRRSRANVYQQRRKSREGMVRKEVFGQLETNLVAWDEPKSSTPKRFLPDTLICGGETDRTPDQDSKSTGSPSSFICRERPCPSLCCIWGLFSATQGIVLKVIVCTIWGTSLKMPMLF